MEITKELFKTNKNLEFINTVAKYFMKNNYLIKEIFKDDSEVIDSFKSNIATNHEQLYSFETYLFLYKNKIISAKDMLYRLDKNIPLDKVKLRIRNSSFYLSDYEKSYKYHLKNGDIPVIKRILKNNLYSEVENAIKMGKYRYLKDMFTIKNNEIKPKAIIEENELKNIIDQYMEKFYPEVDYKKELNHILYCITEIIEDDYPHPNEYTLTQKINFIKDKLKEYDVSECFCEVCKTIDSTAINIKHGPWKYRK